MCIHSSWLYNSTNNSNKKGINSKTKKNNRNKNKCLDTSRDKQIIAHRITWSWIITSRAKSNLYLLVSKVGDHSRAWLEGSISNIYYSVGKSAISFPRLLHFTLDPYLKMLSFKQGDIKYHFLNFLVCLIPRLNPCVSDQLWNQHSIKIISNKKMILRNRIANVGYAVRERKKDQSYNKLMQQVSTKRE